MIGVFVVVDRTPPLICALVFDCLLLFLHLLAGHFPDFNFREDWKPVLTINSIVYGLQYLFLVSNLLLVGKISSLQCHIFGL